MNKFVSVSTVVAIMVASGVASAQQKDKPQESDRAPELEAATHSVELTIATGYAQGFGNVGSNLPSLKDVGTAGGEVQVGVGYRVIPQLTLGVYGSGGMFGRGDQVDSSADLYTSTAGVKADWHFLPAGRELDPWVSLGTGWRGYWIRVDDQGTTSLHGWEIAKLQIGLDYRIAQAVAISPVVGVDLTTFFTQSSATSNGWRTISSPTANAFVFAGVQGRFDIPVGPDSARVASR